MNKDILFKTEEFVFSYRVGGVLINNDKILLMKPKHDGYTIIGGHVSAFETTAETIEREFKEELNADIGVDDLFAVGEIFFPWGKKMCHQICFYYKVHLLNDNEIPLSGTFTGCDDLDSERIFLEFCWVSVEEIKNGLKVYPPELVPFILNDGSKISHFISKQSL